MTKEKHISFLQTEKLKFSWKRKSSDYLAPAAMAPGQHAQLIKFGAVANFYYSLPKSNRFLA